MHAAIRGVNIIREAHLPHLRGVNKKERHLHSHVLVLLINIENIFVQLIFLLREKFYKREQSTLKIKAVENRQFCSSIKNINANAFGEVCLLTQVIKDRLVVKLQFGKNLWIG